MHTPLWIRGRIASLVIFLFMILAGFGFCETKPAPFSIIFSKSKVAFSGTVDSKDSVSALADALVASRPDLEVVNDGLTFDPQAKLPDLTYFKNLVVEVGLSTHDGEIEISDDILMVGGLTDSIVTVSVLRLRADPILGNRKFKERLCQVPTEDLPITPIFLSNGESRSGLSFNFDLQVKKPVPFEAPGVLLHKLFSLIEGTGDFDKLLTGQSAPETAAEPVEIVENTPPPTTEPSELILASRPPSPSTTKLTTGAIDQPEPPNPYDELGPVFFARNNVLLQGGQREKIEYIATRLQSADRNRLPIIIQATTYQSGSRDFDDWLSKRRLAEVVKLLTASGIESDALKTETKASPDRIDQGAVHILVKKLEPALPR